MPTTFAADLAELLVDLLDLFADLGLAADVTVMQDSDSLTVRGIDATDQAGAYAPGNAAVTTQTASFTEIARRRLFVAPADIDGAAWPFEPATGATATWNGATVAVLGVTPVQPGSVVLGYLLDVDA